MRRAPRDRERPASIYFRCETETQCVTIHFTHTHPVDIEPLGAFTLRKALRSRLLAADPSPPSSRKILAKPSKKSTAHSSTMRCLSFISTPTSPGPPPLMLCVPCKRAPLDPNAWPLQLLVTCSVRETLPEDVGLPAFSWYLECEQTGSHLKGENGRHRERKER